MELALHGRRALVTGASSGLGLGCAQALAAEGADVVLLARTADRLASAAATIPTPTHALVGDLSDLDSIPGLVAAAEQLMGGIDIVIVNAGGPPAGNFASLEFEQYEAALRLNLLSGVALCQAALPGMRSRGWGRRPRWCQRLACRRRNQLPVARGARTRRCRGLGSNSRETERAGR